jgi:hypothetical protein
MGDRFQFHHHIDVIRLACGNKKKKKKIKKVSSSNILLYTGIYE